MNLGSRFSIKDCIPSLASSVAKVTLLILSISAKAAASPNSKENHFSNSKALWAKPTPNPEIIILLLFNSSIFSLIKLGIEADTKFP